MGLPVSVLWLVCIKTYIHEYLNYTITIIYITIGGCLSTWNQPFEVMRIEAQAAAARGDKPQGMLATGASVLKSHGIGGLFKGNVWVMTFIFVDLYIYIIGVIPRMGICVWQTLFMVTVPHLIKSTKK